MLIFVGQPPVPQVELDLAASVALSAEAAASGSQAMTETVIGNAEDPASVSSVNGVSAGIGQGGDIVQVASADLSGSAPVTSTVQAVNGNNYAGASDVLVANLQGGQSVDLTNAAETSSTGQGTLDAAASSVNIVNNQ